MAKSKSITRRKSGNGAADMARLQMRMKSTADRLQAEIDEDGWLSRQMLAALEDRIRFNEEAISHRRATTAIVAMFQLCVLYKDADTLSQDNLSPDYRARVFRRMSRLTVSLRDFLYLNEDCSQEFSPSYYIHLSNDDRWLLNGLDRIGQTRGA
jgi:hypothetical protein